MTIYRNPGGQRNSTVELAISSAEFSGLMGQDPASSGSGRTISLGTGLSRLADRRAAGQAASEVVRGCPSGTAPDSPAGHAARSETNALDRFLISQAQRAPDLLQLVLEQLQLPPHARHRPLVVGLIVTQSSFPGPTLACRETGP